MQKLDTGIVTIHRHRWRYFSVVNIHHTSEKTKWPKLNSAVSECTHRCNRRSLAAGHNDAYLSWPWWSTRSQTIPHALFSAVVSLLALAPVRAPASAASAADSRPTSVHLRMPCVRRRAKLLLNGRLADWPFRWYRLVRLFRKERNCTAGKNSLEKVCITRDCGDC